MLYPSHHHAARGHDLPLPGLCKGYLRSDVYPEHHYGLKQGRLYYTGSVPEVPSWPRTPQAATSPELELNLSSSGQNLMRSSSGFSHRSNRSGSSHKTLKAASSHPSLANATRRDAFRSRGS